MAGAIFSVTGRQAFGASTAAVESAVGVGGIGIDEVIRLLDRPIVAPKAVSSGILRGTASSAVQQLPTETQTDNMQ